MKSNILYLAAPAVLCACAFGAPALSAQSAQGYIGHNAQDSSALATAKASDSAESATTQLVRSAINSDTSLPADARNLKIMTVNGRVIISGPVANQEEKDAVMAKAASAVSPWVISNQMYLPPPGDVGSASR
jgi:hyperosmotically inducible periplasmic protein